MKLLALGFLAIALMAQAPRTVTLTWVLGAGSPAGTTVTVYRATGLCTGTPQFAKIAEGVTALTYVDDAVTIGNHCYMVTAVASGMESVPSNFALAGVSPNPPQNLVIRVDSPSSPPPVGSAK